MRNIINQNYYDKFSLQSMDLQILPNDEEHSVECTSLVIKGRTFPRACTTTKTNLRSE